MLFVGIKYGIKYIAYDLFCDVNNLTDLQSSDMRNIMVNDVSAFSIISLP